MTNRLDELASYIRSTDGATDLDRSDGEFLLSIAEKAREVRNAQKAFFASKREGQPGDKALLTESKRLERELGKLLDQETGGLF